MTSTFLRMSVIGAATLVLAACGGGDDFDDDVVAFDPAPAPIFTKDGRVVQQNTVMNHNSSSQCANGMTREEDLEDGDIDCSN